MQCLALTLGTTLKADFIDLSPGEAVAFDGYHFRPAALIPMFSGFHDWLRKSQPDGTNVVVGARIWPHDMSGWGPQLAEKSYIQILQDAPGFIVWFEKPSPYDEELSGDQSFAVNILFPNDRGVAGAVLDMDGIGKNDRVFCSI